MKLLPDGRQVYEIAGNTRLGISKIIWIAGICCAGGFAPAATASAQQISTAPLHVPVRSPRLPLELGMGIPLRMSGSLSLNWRNVGPRKPGFETQIQNQAFLADMYFAFRGPVLDIVPFVLEFQMPTGSQGQPSLYQFGFRYQGFERWDFTLGKFLVPFGRYNELYRPDMFLTVTRPLLYASPDSLDLVVRLNSPRPPFSSGYADIGARASYYPTGALFWMPSEMTFFIVNGLSEASNRSRTFPKPDNLGIPPPSSERRIRGFWA